jgi:hypothetical protein
MDRYQVKAQLFVSDVFDGLLKELKFSTIYWNYPFHPTDKDNNELGLLERGVRDHNYSGLARLLK